MTTEVIRYKIAADQAATFEEAYRKAENWILLLFWDSVEGHEQGFRQEKGFRAFFGLVKPFLGQVQEMKHYNVNGLDWSRAS